MSGVPPPAGPGHAVYAALAGLGAYALVLLVLLAPSGGLLGRYAIRGPDGRDVPVRQQIDPAIDFPVPQRLDAVYIFNWDAGRFGFPATMPPYAIRWTGALRVPESGRYGLALEAEGQAALILDGEAIETTPDTVAYRDLAAGLHPIEVDYFLAQGEARLVLRWRPPGRPLRTISSPYLLPPGIDRSSGSARRALGWLLAGAGAAALLALLVLARRPPAPVARLLAFAAAERTRLALGAILILAAILRFHDYDLVPFHHETADEYQHAWEGWTLFHEGVPRAWSTFPDRYPINQTLDFRWFGDRYVVVRPYFDHPPLFSILVGLLTRVWVPESYPSPWSFLSLTLPVARLVPILLSLAGILLLHRLARRYGATESAALLAALVYATLPLIVMSHRLVKAESLLALLFMGTILAVMRHDETGGRGSALSAAILCGLSLWTKATGVAVPATALLLLLGRRRHRAAALVAATSAAFLLLYLLYAAGYDLGIFLKVIQAQATTKWVGLDAVQDLLAGKVVVKWFGRGWYLWLLLAAGVAAFRKERALLVPLLVYGAVIVMTADHRVIYGWYRIPIYPFLCVAAGLYLETLLRDADLFVSAPFACTAVGTGLLYALPEGMAESKPAVFLFVLLALGPYLARLAHEGPATRRLARAATYLLVALFLVTSLMSVQGLLEIYSATRGVR